MSNISLRNKRVLFIAQVFYDYHLQIQRELEQQGAEVIFMENKLFRQDPVLNKDLIAVFKRTLDPSYKEKYNDSIVSEVRDKKIDYLFCLGGFSITPGLIDTLKQSNPGMKAIVYFWDSFTVWDYRYLIGHFDKVYTFDPRDAKAYQLEYLPLFYTKEFNTKGSGRGESGIDLLYIGSVGPASIDRVLLLKKLKDEAISKGLTHFFWLFYKERQVSLPVRMINIGRKLVSKKYRTFINTIARYKKEEDFIRSGTLSREEVAAYLSKTKCVIDIPVPNQAGLTIRTLETLAAGKKVITTNEYIKEEPFYSPQQIAVIDRDNVSLDPAFIRHPDAGNVAEEITYLRIDNWLTKIFSNN